MKNILTAAPLVIVLALGSASSWAQTAASTDGRGSQGTLPNATQGEHIGSDVDSAGVDTGTDVTDGTATTDGTGIADGMGKLDNGPTPRIGEAPDNEPYRASEQPE